MFLYKELNGEILLNRIEWLDTPKEARYENWILNLYTEKPE